ncbi:hypothetical protein DK926_23035 [Rhodococcus sp. Eu-32]|uniref:hypothetical protein n=1 Tax=Rhodococcus sp. Eu-32 TaxID=1017319 RepID=UPI000F78D281|nr:hypothetical protein [Rhodococcus sp. Eu-32]RRQ25498.1 hypothetical protein DK926_23035 [Rhodococcus sp. Eu-32]
MATYQLRGADDAVLAQTELPSDTRAMAWMVSAATVNRRALDGKRWEGFRLDDSGWEHRFSGAYRKQEVGVGLS